MFSLFEGKPDHPQFDLQDSHNSYVNASMLMESGAFELGNFYQALMRVKSSEIKLTRLLAEGDDYEQAGIEWIEPQSS